MVKVKVEKSGWDAIVSQTQQSITSIESPKISKFSKTTLKRVKSLEQTQEILKNLIKNYKTVSEKEINKMKQAGERVVQEDNQAAQAMK